MAVGLQPRARRPPRAPQPPERSLVPVRPRQSQRRGQACSTAPPGPGSGPSNVNDGGGVGAATHRGDRLTSGDVLSAGQYVAGAQPADRAGAPRQRRPVLYGPSPSTGKGYSVRWSRNTAGADRLVMQG